MPLTLLAVLALSSAQPPILLPAAAAVLGGGLSPSSRNSSSAPAAAAAAARDLRGLPNLKFHERPAVRDKLFFSLADLGSRKWETASRLQLLYGLGVRYVRT